jgi:DNA-binding CsgD family transcriptional regulator
VPRPARRPLVLRFIRLNNGETLADAAERLKIAGETARTRLKANFAKTEIHKQGALVALLPRVGRAF